MAKLLLVDDDIELSELLISLLNWEGFEVEAAYNGQEALDKMGKESYDLVLLDIMMPVLNGIETLKCIRQKYLTPVIMLTARGNEIDRVIGLELGADDYLPKPFNDRELVARIKAILRRSVMATPTPVENTHPVDEKVLEFGGISLHLGRQQAYFNNKDIELTGTEFALLQILITHPGEILSREYLSEKVLSKTLTPFDRSIDMHMSNLRKKLPLRDDNLAWFKTLRGKGYLLVSDE